jgi:arylsulfatase
MKIAVEFEQSLKKYPPIAPGTADPYKPPKSQQLSKENPKER